MDETIMFTLLWVTNFNQIHDLKDTRIIEIIYIVSLLGDGHAEKRNNGKVL